MVMSTALLFSWPLGQGFGIQGGGIRILQRKYTMHIYNDDRTLFIEMFRNFLYSPKPKIHDRYMETSDTL